MDPIIAKYATRTVPRYTSYPTAPHFSSAVDGATVAGWLAQLDAKSRLSLYLHVPYCRAMCTYCGCHTKVTTKDEPLVDCAMSLRDEIDCLRAAVGRPLIVDHIHWGGGTPSLLPPDQFYAIVGDLRDAFQFDEGLEHAIEIDPRSLSEDLVKVLAEVGVNRVSLGVQDFDVSVQQAIGRVQPYEMVARTVDMLRGAGIEAINFDLIYGLPLQISDGFVKTAHLACDLNPSRIALFGYAHVPWFKKHQQLIDVAQLPGASERQELEAAARETFEARGFQSIGLDHFARPDDDLAIAAAAGRMRRNFQGYTTDSADALIGLGASSISKFPQGYAQNAPDIGGWRRAISDQRLATIRGLALSDDDIKRGAIIEQLMTKFAVDISPLVTGRPDLENEFRARLEPLQADGLVELDGTLVRMRENRRSLVRIVAAVFDAYLEDGGKKHSVAV